MALGALLAKTSPASTEEILLSSACVFIQILQTGVLFPVQHLKQFCEGKRIMPALLCNSSPIIDLFTGDPTQAALSTAFSKIIIIIIILIIIRARAKS